MYNHTSQVSLGIPGMTYIYRTHDNIAAIPYKLDKPTETLQPKTSSLKPPNTWPHARLSRKFSPCGEWVSDLVCVGQQDKDLSRD